VKLAFVFPPMLVGGRPLDFGAIDTSPRGTTGSEMQILSIAREMAARGHSATLYIDDPNRGEWMNVALRPFQGLHGDRDLYQAICTSLDINVARWVSPTSAYRVVFQQLNDFNYANGKDFADFVDLFVSPSFVHQQFMEESWPTTKGKWEMLPNGCYPAELAMRPEDVRVPGRMIYASSPDRGLHLLLQEWLEIRKACPQAHLKIFYYSLQSWIDRWKTHTIENPAWHWHFKENFRRAKYIDRALHVLKDQGIEVVGPVSRRQLADEMRQAEVLAYPCDTIAWTEGFSCATLEGCASGALPIISAMDALGSIYETACPMVPAPARKHMPEWRNLVVRALTDKPWAEGWRRKGAAFAGAAYGWPVLAERLERILEKRLPR